MQNSDGFGLSKVGQIAVNVKDIDRAEAFYSDKLGMKHLFKAPNLSFFDCGGITLMLDIPEEPRFDHPSSIVYFQVDDIQKAFSTLSDREVKFEDRPHVIADLGEYNLWMTFFQDSEGNVMALMSKAAK